MGEADLPVEGPDDDPRVRHALLTECGEILQRLRRPVPAPRTSPEEKSVVPQSAARVAAAGRPRAGGAGGGSLVGAAMDRTDDLTSVLGPRPHRGTAG